jgi:hypothetical protein
MTVALGELVRSWVPVPVGGVRYCDRVSMELAKKVGQIRCHFEGHTALEAVGCVAIGHFDFEGRGVPVLIHVVCTKPI